MNRSTLQRLGAEARTCRFVFEIEDQMAAVTIRPTALDIRIADAIAAHTHVPAERAAKTLTWGADEHALMALAAAWWLYSRSQRKDLRNAADHVLITTMVASTLPHFLKAVFNQRRPDRFTVRGHWRGVPLSGKSMDAFPSGHALHVGALASAASQLPKTSRNLAWSIGAGLVATRIILLAHWTSDVVVGLVMGAMTERLLRRVTGFGRGTSRTVRLEPEPSRAVDRQRTRGCHPWQNRHVRSGSPDASCTNSNMAN